MGCKPTTNSLSDSRGAATTQVSNFSYQAAWDSHLTNLGRFLDTFCWFPGDNFRRHRRLNRSLIGQLREDLTIKSGCARGFCTLKSLVV